MYVGGWNFADAWAVCPYRLLRISGIAKAEFGIFEDVDTGKWKHNPLGSTVLRFGLLQFAFPDGKPRIDVRFVAVVVS